MSSEPVPDNLLLALYIAWRVARKGKSQAIITNSALKAHLKMDKVNSRRMNRFADSLKPIFPKSLPEKEGYGLKNRVVLCLNGDDTQFDKDKAVRFDSIPDRATIFRNLSKVD